MKPNQMALQKAMRGGFDLRRLVVGRPPGSPQRSPQRPKVAWCIPLEDTVYAAWFTHYLKMESAPGDRIITTMGAFIDTARNNLVELFLQSDCEYLFFLDSDTCPPFDAVDRLLQTAVVSGQPSAVSGQQPGARAWSPEKPIVAGWYNVKKAPHHPCVFDYVGWNEARQWHDYHPRESAPEDPAAPACSIGCGRHHSEMVERVDAIGFGCVLIRRDVFTDPSGAFGKLTGTHPGSPRWFTTEEGGTEDMSFCRRCAKAGVPVVVDWSVHCAHIGVVRI